MDTPLPTISVTGGISSTVTSLQGGAQSFVGNAWPAIITLVLFVFFVILAWRIGSKSLGRMRGLGRGL